MRGTDTKKSPYALVGERGTELSGGQRQRIAVLDGGRIIELGTHQELIEHNGTYARLYSPQFRDPEEDLAALRATVLPSKSNGHRDRTKLPEQPTGVVNVILGRK